MYGDRYDSARSARGGHDGQGERERKQHVGASEKSMGDGDNNDDGDDDNNQNNKNKKRGLERMILERVSAASATNPRQRKQHPWSCSCLRYCSYCTAGAAKQQQQPSQSVEGVGNSDQNPKSHSLPFIP